MEKKTRESHEAMRLLFIFLLAVFIYSCDSGNVTGVGETDAPVSDTVVPFRGVWVVAEYIDTLRHMRSAIRSQGSEFFVRIPGSTGDTGYSFVYHEGGGQFNIAKSGQSYFLKWVGSDSEQVTVLENGKKIRIGDRLFVKVPDSSGILK